MSSKITAAVAISALVLTACSSRPRTFSAELAAPPADRAAFAASQVRCHELAVEQTGNGSGRLASAGTGVAAGAGAAAVGAAATSGTYASFGAAAAAGAALVVAVPIVGLGAAWGIAKAKRAKKESRIKEATAICLADQGYTVAGWSKVRKGGDLAAAAAEPVDPTADSPADAADEVAAAD